MFVGLLEVDDWPGRDCPRGQRKGAHWCGSSNSLPFVKHLDAQGRSTSRAERPKFDKTKPASVIVHRWAFVDSWRGRSSCGLDRWVSWNQVKHGGEY